MSDNCCKQCVGPVGGSIHLGCGFGEVFERLIVHLRWRMNWRMLLSKETSHALRSEKMLSYFEDMEVVSVAECAKTVGRCWGLKSMGRYLGPTRLCPLHQGVCIFNLYQQQAREEYWEVTIWLYYIYILIIVWRRMIEGRGLEMPWNQLRRDLQLTKEVIMVTDWVILRGS